MNAIVSALLLTAVVVLPHTANAQQTPQLLIVRLSVQPTEAGTQNVNATYTTPNGRTFTRTLRNVTGTCVEDVGGMESLSVVRCEVAADRSILDFEILERGRNIVVNEYVTRPNAERKRTRRTTLVQSRRGWAVVPRCAETFDHPLACPPPR